ncbi:hypothetical protein CLPU_16c00100 [Gottschalkia purinilytica]|uniref:Small, acid-soluble spore protein, alpha/beta type n=1 Tax=Gottschalkia purinilytica TaxID=1503 RepID=A0A0L0W7Q3_GOTPU|nr:hypothetical protein [Gottschalkia purinilytica]KNF07457.1 hypothetical protein CLPU_16c00100 [Gottschalkia purinilytica]
MNKGNKFSSKSKFSSDSFKEEIAQDMEISFRDRENNMTKVTDSFIDSVKKTSIDKESNLGRS